MSSMIIVSTSYAPLVTFMLLSYNQERWVKEAVRSALNQNYQNLEIFFSDDCSTDRTFDIIQREVSAYRGPHKLVVSQNKRNVGLARHINETVRRASGSLIIYGCGDDVSLPQRTSRIVERWQECGLGPVLIHSLYQSIDENGYPLADKCVIDDRWYYDLRELCETNMFVQGATSAYTKDLFVGFPELLPELVHEDCCTPFRARLIGAPVVSLDEKLVLYRQVGLTSKYTDRWTTEETRMFFKRRQIDYRQKQLDAKSFSRHDLLQIIKRKVSDYVYAEMCLDPLISTPCLLRFFYSLRPSFWFSAKQILKYRIVRSITLTSLPWLWI